MSWQPPRHPNVNGIFHGVRVRVPWYAVEARGRFRRMPWKMPWKVLPQVVTRHAAEKDNNVHPKGGPYAAREEAVTRVLLQVRLFSRAHQQEKSRQYLWMTQMPHPERMMYTIQLQEPFPHPQSHVTRLASRILNPLCTTQRAGGEQEYNPIDTRDGKGRKAKKMCSYAAT